MYDMVKVNYLILSFVNIHDTKKYSHFIVDTCVAQWGRAFGYRSGVMRSSPATGHNSCAMLANQTK